LLSPQASPLAFLSARIIDRSMPEKEKKGKKKIEDAKICPTMQPSAST